MHPMTQTHIEQLEESIKKCEERIQIFEGDGISAFPGVESNWKTGKELADETRRMIEETKNLIEWLKKQSS